MSKSAVGLEKEGRCRVGSNHFLISNSLILKKLNSNSLITCERIQIYLFIFYLFALLSPNHEKLRGTIQARLGVASLLES